MKKVLVALPDGIVNLLDNELTGKLGEGRSDTLRTIIMNWSGEKAKKEIQEELDLLSTMLKSLVDLLEKKGVLTHVKWEKQIKQKIKI